MAAAESETVFFARLEELGLGDLKSKFQEFGWTSFADFAFACSDFKNSDPKLFQSEVIEPLVGAETNRIPRIRRLYMQSYVVGSAEMERYANPQPDIKVAMHPADRADGMQRVSKRITGFVVRNESEPSHALIDRCATIAQKGVVKYVPWERCTSRDAETMEEAEVPGLKLTPEGVFVPVPNTGPDADLAGEMRWDLALRRRCLAFDVSGLSAFETANLWPEVLKAAYLRVPPKGYLRVSWLQLLEADKALFRKIAEDCPAGCKAKPGEAITEFEKAYKAATFSMEVRLHLQPLQASSSSASSSPASALVSVPDSETKVRKLEGRLKQTEEQLRGTKRRLEAAMQSQGSRKGGGKGSKRGSPGGRQREHRNHVAVMAGMATKTKDNESICFNYNLAHGCTLAQPGQRCPRGWHVCAKLQCQKAPQPHSATSPH